MSVRCPILRLVAVGFLLGPLVVLAVGAVSVRWFFPQVVPHTLTLSGVRRVGLATVTLRAVGTGLGLSGVVMVASLAIGWPVARMLSRPGFRWRWVMVMALFLPSVLPAVGLAVGLDVVLLRFHLAGTFSGVVLAHLVPTAPYAVAMLTAVFARHDDRVEQQASVLGANMWQVWRMVTVPMMAPGLAVAAVLTFLVSWSQYLITLLVGGGRVVTLSMLVFNAAAGGNPTNLGVLAIMAALPAIVLLTAVSRRLAATVGDP